ncbi:MFS transporter [Zafaria cholistanensis]|uniref:MFS transporter n=1 Tax=Zafaria cholistanensis TaxID=1682741 RepID=A0A5A7NSM8_9MICC|nr:MFS transporter [Zafaria cholistanensis]GER22761.1 MFS transporter [Zafaria cholistanensis]
MPPGPSPQGSPPADGKGASAAGGGAPRAAAETSPGLHQDIGWIVVVLSGIAAAMHIWKLPNALAVIQSELGFTLVEAGLLMGIIQVASMAGGLLVAWSGELFGLRRLLVAGLALLSAGSLLGAAAPTAGMLMASRAVEGVGFLLCTVLAPPLIQRTCRPERTNIAMASWGAFQGTATLLGFASAALALGTMGWRGWWIVMAAVALAPMAPVLCWVPADRRTAMDSVRQTGERMLTTLRHPGPWIAGAVFAAYTVQWMAIMGFLPTVYASAGLQGPWPGLLSAVVGGVNALGALASGVLMQRGYRARGLLLATFATMAASSVVVFAVPWPAGAAGVAGQFAAAVAFSLVGGMAPAVLTRVAVDLPPPDGSVPAVIGLMQQIFNVGNFVGPPLLAAIATLTGGWQSTWWMTCGFGLLGCALAWLLPRNPAEVDARPSAAPAPAPR